MYVKKMRTNTNTNKNTVNQPGVCVCVCVTFRVQLTVDVEARGAGHDAGFVLGRHGVPARVFLHGRLDDHAQVATVVLVHAGKGISHFFNF